MKTVNEILNSVDNLASDLRKAGSDGVISPTLCWKLIEALSVFGSITREQRDNPTKGVILQMMKEKINAGHLTEAEVVDALIGNTREQAKKTESNDGCM